MNPHQQNLELARRYVEGTATADETRALEEALRTDAAFRRQFLRYTHVDAALGSGRLSAASFAPRARVSQRPARFGWLSWLPLTAAAAGVVFGFFCASVAWAYTAPRVVATASRLFSLVDGGFEKHAGRLPAGFPFDPGIWSGDEAEMVSSQAVLPKEGRQVLRFIRAGGQALAAAGPAEACDVYQIVDLRPLREQIKTASESMLELSANFLDARTTVGVPVGFSCHIYLFTGTPESLRSVWPPTARDTLGVGASYIISHGGAEAGGWRKVTARCVLTSQADVAVIKLTAGRGERRYSQVPELGMQFADAVELTLKTQPVLPVRLVQQ